MTLLADKACREYLDGVKDPRAEARKGSAASSTSIGVLNETTGFGVEGVPALIPPSRFYELAVAGQISAGDLHPRRREHIDYIEEPDLFHEVFGHCPLLTNQSYANFVRRFGENGRPPRQGLFLAPVPDLLVHCGIRPHQHAAGTPLLRRRHRLLAQRGAGGNGRQGMRIPAVRPDDSAENALPDRYRPADLLRHRQLCAIGSRSSRKISVPRSTRPRLSATSRRHSKPRRPDRHGIRFASGLAFVGRDCPTSRQHVMDGTTMAREVDRSRYYGDQPHIARPLTRPLPARSPSCGVGSPRALTGADAVVWGIPFDAATSNRPGEHASGRRRSAAPRRSSTTIRNIPSIAISSPKWR